MLVDMGREEEEDEKNPPKWPQEPSWYVKELPANESIGDGVKDYELCSGYRVRARISAYGATMYSVVHRTGEVPETWELKKYNWENKQIERKEKKKKQEDEARRQV